MTSLNYGHPVHAAML